MKKILFSLSMMAVLIFAGQSCKKASAEDNIAQTEDYQSADSDEGYEIEAPEFEEEPYQYEPEAVGMEITGGTKVTASEDPDNSCATFKYATPGSSASWSAPIKVGKGSAAVICSLKLSGLQAGASRLDSIVNTNTTTGKSTTTWAYDDVKSAKVGGRLVLSNLTPGADSLNYTFKLETQTDDFTVGTAACRAYWSVTSAAGVKSVKSKSISVKCIGVSATGKTFGTQRWGFDKFGGAAAKYTATPTPIDTIGVGNFIPTTKSILCFGPTKRAVIDSLEVFPVLSTWTAAEKKKGAKYVFKYHIYNSKCTSTKKISKMTTRQDQFPTSKLYTDGPVPTGFIL